MIVSVGRAIEFLFDRDHMFKRASRRNAVDMTLLFAVSPCSMTQSFIDDTQVAGGCVASVSETSSKLKSSCALPLCAHCS